MTAGIDMQSDKQIIDTLHTFACPFTNPSDGSEVRRYSAESDEGSDVNLTDFLVPSR